MCVCLSKYLADLFQSSDESQSGPLLEISDGQVVGQIDRLDPPYDPTLEPTNPHDDEIAESVKLPGHRE